MKRRTRYLFIALGFLTFGIISPLIVLYVSGFSYDWRTDQLSSTGLLSIKTEPSKAEIFLDNEDMGTAPSTLRFLKPKDYNLSIRKEGYFDWNKRLEIKAGKVTWASDRLPELHLIRKDPAPIIVSSGVRDFFPGNNFSLYLTEHELIRTKLGESATTESVNLPAACDQLTVSPSQTLVLLNCGAKKYLYNQTDLTPVSLNLSDDQSYSFGPENSLYNIESGVLIKTNPETGKREQIGNNVSTFGFQGNSLYRLQTNPSGDQNPTQTLISSPLYSPEQTQTLIKDVPEFKTVKLLISRPKEIFILGDGTLFRVNEKLEPLLSDISEIGFDAESPALTYTTGFELYAYDFNRAVGQLVMRNAGTMKSPQGKTDIGYLLYINDNKIQAAELDSRDHVNNYTIASGTDIKKYTTDPSHSWVYFLDGSTLKFFMLR